MSKNQCRVLLKKNYILALPKVVRQQFIGEVGKSIFRGFIFIRCQVSLNATYTKKLLKTGRFYTDLFEK